MKLLCYYLNSTDEFLTVHLPELPFGKSKIVLNQNEKRIDASMYDVFELHAIDIEFTSDGQVLYWSKAKLKDICETSYFLAYLADGRVLCNNGKAYKLYENDALRKVSKKSDFNSHLEYMLTGNPIDSINNIKVYILNDTIYGVESCKDFVYRESWSVEDYIFNYISSYDRYYNPENKGAISGKQRLINAAAKGAVK